MDWRSFYDKAGKRDASDLLQCDPWQERLADKIIQLRPRRLLECGCGYGQTSYLLAAHVRDPVLLDYQEAPLVTAREMFVQGTRTGNFVMGDLLNMAFIDNYFDVVFNAGVLEHFDFSGRTRALSEMVRVVKPVGKVVVAIPNHFSVPYRYSYRYRKKQGDWPYPDEYPLYDLTEEVRAAGLKVHQLRETVCRETSFHFLRRHQRIIFTMLAQLRRFEGYLTILTLEKTG